MLGLGEREARYLLTHVSDFAGLDLKQLPTEPGVSARTATALFNQFLRLAGYARLKRELAGNTDDFITIFEADATGERDKVYTLIAALTRRDTRIVAATARALFGESPAFASEQPLQRLW